MYALNDEQLKRLLDKVKTFSDDITMEFGLGNVRKRLLLKVN